MSLGSNGVDRHVRSDKFKCDFVTRTFALIAPDWPICTEFSAVNKMVPNAPKQYEMQQNMSFGFHVVYRVSP